jgi:hypothetical protein
MYTVVTCTTCGCPVGDVAVFYHQERIALVREILAKRGTEATHAAVDAGLQIDCSDILNRLAIINDCCRKSLVTGMNFNDYY